MAEVLKKNIKQDFLAAYSYNKAIRFKLEHLVGEWKRRHPQIFKITIHKRIKTIPYTLLFKKGFDLR